jgi:hypothetical protein
VVGGGLGDIEEVLCAGRRLAANGFSITLLRLHDRPLPPSVSGPWEWPPHRRIGRLRRVGAVALTISAGWGITAAPARAEPFGRAGPWAVECSEIEARYGPERTVHVSFEEFARTLTSRQQTAERWREGGVPVAAIAHRLAEHRDREISVFEDAYRKFRAFGRANVLHLYATFQFDASFARAFPEAVQTGPLWPHIGWPRRPRSRRREWVWYASPATSERLIPEVAAGLDSSRSTPHLWIRTPRPFRKDPSNRNVTVLPGPMDAWRWRRRFVSADVRIVTGSRTLLEALELGRPFLYFNGLLGSGSRTRRHRPEKIASLLRLWRSEGVGAPWCRDLSDFSRGRRVREIVRRVANREASWSRFSGRTRARGFRPPFDDAGALVVAVARTLRRNTATSDELVSRIRAGDLSGPMRA